MKLQILFNLELLIVITHDVKIFMCLHTDWCYWAQPKKWGF